MRSLLARVRIRLAHALHPQVHRDGEGHAHQIARPLGVGSAWIGGELRAFLALGHGSADPLYIPLDHSELADVRTQLRAAQQRLDDHGETAANASERADRGGEGDDFADWPNAAETATDTDSGPIKERPLGVGFLGPDAEDVETVRVRPGESVRDAVARARRMKSGDAEDAAAGEESGEDEMEHTGEGDGIDGTDIPIDDELGEEGSP
jgi:hypothetical protein